MINYNIVKSPEKRELTNKFSLVIYPILSLILFGLIGYTISKADSNYQPNLIWWNRCLNENEMFLNRSTCIEQPIDKSEIAWIAFVDFIITLIILVLFSLLCRFCSKCVVLAISIIAIIVNIFFIYGIYDFYDTMKTKYTNYNVGIISGISFALIEIFVIINLAIILISLSKFKLVAFMLMQTIKVMCYKPFLKLWIIPFLGLFCIALVVGVGLLSTYWMITALLSPNNTLFEAIIMSASTFLNIFMTLWTIDIIKSYFYMAASNSVAIWYFNQIDCGFPLGVSLKNSARYHFGSVIFGTFIINILLEIFQIVFLLRSYELSNAILLFVMIPTKQILAIIPSYAFIETTIHGSSYWDSFKTIGSLFSLNKLIFISTNGLVDLISQFIYGLVISKSVVLSISWSSSDWESTQLALTLSVSILITSLPIIIILSLFRTTLDSLFLCFCEHARIARRYSNIRELYEFLTFAGSVHYKLPPSQYSNRPIVKRVTHQKLTQ